MISSLYLHCMFYFAGVGLYCKLMLLTEAAALDMLLLLCCVLEKILHDEF